MAKQTANHAIWNFPPTHIAPVGKYQDEFPFKGTGSLSVAIVLLVLGKKWNDPWHRSKITAECGEVGERA